MELLKRIEARTQKRTAAIAKKVHPALPPLLQAYGNGWKGVKALGTNPPIELVTEVEARMVRDLRKVAEQYPEIPIPALDLIHPDLADPQLEVDPEKTLLEFFHFQRHLRPLGADLKANFTDGQACIRLGRTLEDYGMAQSGKRLVKPSKANLDHTQVFLMGLGMGLEKLSPEELAEFFDQNCWCDKSHDGDALKKHRKRIFIFLPPRLATILGR